MHASQFDVRPALSSARHAPHPLPLLYLLSIFLYSLMKIVTIYFVIEYIPFWTGTVLLHHHKHHRKRKPPAACPHHMPQAPLPLLGILLKMRHYASWQPSHCTHSAFLPPDLFPSCTYHLQKNHTLCTHTCHHTLCFVCQSPHLIPLPIPSVMDFLHF